MKLLSRFIWLIVGVSVLVFAAISILNFRADKEFEKIKQTVSVDYEIMIDELLKPESTDIYTYCYDVATATSTSSFLLQNEVNEQDVDVFLDTMLLNLFRVDAVWFFRNDGSLFYFFSHSGIGASDLNMVQTEISEVMKNGSSSNFYIKNDDDYLRIFTSTIGDAASPQGCVFAATKQDYRWINEYQKAINNSYITIRQVDAMKVPIPEENINLERGLISFDGSTIAKLNVELALPYLKLWHSTAANDKLLLVGSMVLTLILLLLFISLWVVFPLKRISTSLSEENSTNILSLLKSKTEMGEVARMIGDYHKKKEELATSESIKRHIIEQAQVGIMILDDKTLQILTVNNYACRLIGMPEEAIVGNLCSSFLRSSEEEKDYKQFLYQNVEDQESTLYNSKGEKIPVLHTSKRVMLDGNHVIMETFVNLSDIKTLQSKLEEEKTKLSLAMKNSGLTFCEYDFKNDKLSIAEEWAFVSNGEKGSTKENILDNIYQTDVKNFKEQFESLSVGGKDAVTIEFRFKHSTRGLIWVSLSALITKRGENFEPSYLIGSLEDITERINVQQELISAKEKAEESDRMKTAYLANMSYKIRTPMNAIVGFANLLSEEDLSKEDRDTYIKIIGRDTEQLLKLIDDIINVAKIDSNQIVLTNSSCNINSIMDDLASYYKAYDKTENIKFSVQTMLPNGKDLIHIDGEKLKQVMDNLLNNAFKFTKKGEVDLGYFVNPATKKIILYVKDTGIGIPGVAKDKVFNLFYQVDEQTEGTGLGLTISQGIVKLLNGKLTLESELGKGSTFFVELPFED